jgi:hypothetical protein
VLIDKALNRGYVLSPLAAPHHRRDGLVFHGPSDQGKRSRPSPGGGRGNPKLALSAIVPETADRITLDRRSLRPQDDEGDRDPRVLDRRSQEPNRRSSDSGKRPDHRLPSWS